MACLSDWLVDRGLEPTEFDDVAIEEFLEARRRAGHVEWRTRVGLAPMLGFLRGMGVVPTPAPAVDMSPAGQLIAAYRRSLTAERGMGWSARRSEERRVGEECVGTCGSRWSRYH